MIQRLTTRSLYISTALVALVFMGCSEDVKFSKPIPTTGVFTEAAEGFYLKRYEISLEAFRSGKGTTNYDTEIIFGETLKNTPLPRGTNFLSTSLLTDLSDYARRHNSDSFMIYAGGKVISESYFGETTSESLINAKSLAKPLGVIAIGRAIKAGFIKSLDQPASDFIVEWKATDKDAVTIRHLLDMRSGLLPQGRAQGPEDVLNRAYLHPHHDEVIIHEYPLTDPPGSRYEYSNANSELVAVIISRASEMSYQDWLAKEVFAPLGAPGGKIWMNREGGLAHSGCCVALTSETYLKLGVMILNQGKWNGEAFLPKTFITEMTTPTAQNQYAAMGVYVGRKYKKFRGAANPDISKDFSAALHSEPYLDEDILLFDGNGNQVIYMLPSRNIAILRLGSRPRSETPWDNAYLPNHLIRNLDR